MEGKQMREQHAFRPTLILGGRGVDAGRTEERVKGNLTLKHPEEPPSKR